VWADTDNLVDQIEINEVVRLTAEQCAHTSELLRQVEVQSSLYGTYKTVKARF